jgi:hypothetical protein
VSVFVARQAIFNRRKNVVAYELLFRDSPKNYFPDVAEGHATARLIMENQLNLGTRHITSGKKALINIGPESLKLDLCAFLPCQDVVIELLETIEPTDDNYALCGELFDSNYKLALDDFVYKPQWERFLKLVNLVKFDIKVTPLNEIMPIVKKLKRYIQKELTVICKLISKRFNEIKYFKSLKNDLFIENKKNDFNLENINYETFMLIIYYQDTKTIDQTLLSSNIINDLIFLGYEELIEKITNLNEKILLKYNLIKGIETVKHMRHEMNNLLNLNEILVI